MRGFSLIELMVVIAIVAILSAIAVPVYNKHILVSKITSAFPVIQIVLDNAKTFLDRNDGQTISSARLGLAAYTGSAPGDSGASGMPPGEAGGVLDFIGAGDFYQCNLPGKVSEVIVGYNKYSLGLSDTPGSDGTGRLVFFIYNVDGVYKTECVNVDLLSGSIPGCIDDWSSATSAAMAGCL